MDMNRGVVIWVAVLGLTAVVAFIVYRWQQRERVRGVEEWVKNYLTVRYGELPSPLRINCSDDQLWPVLVGCVLTVGLAVTAVACTPKAWQPSWRPEGVAPSILAAS